MGEKWEQEVCSGPRGLCSAPSALVCVFAVFDLPCFEEPTELHRQPSLMQLGSDKVPTVHSKLWLSLLLGNRSMSCSKYFAEVAFVQASHDGEMWQRSTQLGPLRASPPIRSGP